MQRHNTARPTARLRARAAAACIAVVDVPGEGQRCLRGFALVVDGDLPDDDRRPERVKAGDRGGELGAGRRGGRPGPHAVTPTDVTTTAMHAAAARARSRAVGRAVLCLCMVPPQAILAPLA